MAEPGRVALLWTLGAVAVAAFGLALGWGDDGRDGRWLATYRAPSGETVVRRESDVRVHWGKGAPQPGWPGDGFSQRFSTCLQAPDARRVTLLLGADDTASIWLDEHRVLGRSGPSAYAEQRVEVTLTGERQPLRIESTDLRGASSLELWLEDGHGERTRIPASWLTLPPC